MYNYRFIKGKQGPYDKWKNLFYGHSEQAFSKRAKLVSVGAVPPSSRQAVQPGMKEQLCCHVFLPAQETFHLGTAEDEIVGEECIKSLSGEVSGERKGCLGRTGLREPAQSQHRPGLLHQGYHPSPATRARGLQGVPKQHSSCIYALPAGGSPRH